MAAGFVAGTAGAAVLVVGAVTLLRVGLYGVTVGVGVVAGVDTEGIATWVFGGSIVLDTVGIDDDDDSCAGAGIGVNGIGIVARAGVIDGASSNSSLT